MLERLPANGSTGKRVLDVGGGEGFLSRQLSQRGFEVTCIAQPGTTARGLPENVRIIEADLDFELPELDSFGYVVCGDVIEHVRDPDRLLRWLRGRLEPRGKMIASLPNSGHFYFRANVLCGRFPEHEKGLFDRTHLHFYTLSGWKHLFARTGYVLESVAPTSIPIGLATGLGHENPIVRVGEAFNHFVARIWKKMLAYQFVVVARPDVELRPE